MNLSSLLQSIGSIGFFSSRIFLPALITALALRFGGHLPGVLQWGLLAHHPANHPVWFTSDACLIALTILAVLETAAQKNVEARRWLTEFDIYLKPALAALTSFGVVSATDAQFVQQTAHASVAFGGFGDSIGPFLAALGTWRVGAARKNVTLAILDHVEGTHLDHLLNWLEEAWVAFGVMFLILFPVLMVGLIAIAIGILYMIQRRLMRSDQNSRIACPRCGTMIYPCAVSCPTCKWVNGAPNAVGWLGGCALTPASNVAEQPYRLFASRRCPACATRLPAGRPFEPCPVCGALPNANPAFTRGYVEFVSRRLPRVLAGSFLVGLIPILGLIVAAVYYRIEILLPFGQYFPAGKRFLLRWGIRLLFFVVCIIHIIPIVGAWVAPTLAAISFGAYRSAYESMLAEHAKPS